MRSVYYFIFLISCYLQAQNGFNYQAIINDASGAVVASQTIGVQLSILYNSSSGTVAYSELHNPTTDANGLINLRIGTGTQLSSAAFSSVDWSTSYIYLKSEIDITGSGTYVDVGTDLIGQVPVALFAKQLEGITITSGTISATGANLSGTVTASAFVGDGSGLTNVVASSSPTPTFLYGTENVLLDGTTSPNVGTMDRSVGLGYLTLNSVTSGNKNVAIGARVMEENTTGFMNVGIGWNALNKNTVGRSNVAIGGSEALDANTTGNYNVAIGDRAMTYNTTGDSNIAIGYLSLGNNDAGNYNTMIGYGTGSNIRTESGNTGNDNVGVGYRALEKNYSGDKNVGIGFDALRETKGSGNLGIGTNAGKTITTGSNNTLIGYDADVASNAITNATAIGANAVVDASNKIRLGDNSITVIEGKVGFTISSDRRLKANIENTKYGLETILKLAPVDYTLKSNGLAQIGFIAQDVQPLVPEAVNGTEGALEKGETLGITYTTLIPVLTKAIQQQQQIIDRLLKRIEALESEK